MALHTNRLAQSGFLFPSNNAQGQGALGADGVRFITDLKTASSALSGTLRELSGPAFSSRTMTSSDNDVMSVSFTGNRPNNINPMTVKIDQTAAGQMNEGARMTANAAYEGNSGVNRIAIESRGETTQISVNVRAGDTNRDVQQRTADAINNAGIGIRATVETNSETNASMLRLESTHTGSDPRNSFTVSDVTGDLAARMGANDVSREGRDAIFSVNGGPERTSQTNTVDLGNGISATFNRASENAVTISRGQDTSHAIRQVENMVRNYNDLYSAAAQRTNDPKTQNLASRMVNTSRIYSNSLSSIGIGFDNDGRMTIDSQRMNQAAESGRLEQFFTENSGRNYGFTNQLGRLADNVQRNTSNFVTSSVFGNDLGENFSYSNLGNLMQFNFLTSGSIMDFMI
jgi:flagellar hook-associated protein 2